MGLKNLFHRKKKSDTIPAAATSPSPTPSRTSTSRAQIEEELKQVFKKFDGNGDGKISWSELGSIMGSLGHRPSDDELENMIKEVDSDGDGFIDLNEFIELNTRDIDTAEVLENLKEAFSVFDIDKNGLISAEELQKVLGSLEENCTIDECRKMISGVDVNGDGMISFDEFRVMMVNGITTTTNNFDNIGGI
uniref:probable calcium-binding protein CML25 n=1 Tax=Erigeron canadensis TaxID=72917 RepID=UPI001CB9D2A3|nr:probable calcium-binding protein CML25 [Erigeron canadensis]